jgi:hypothetical protein
VDRSAGRSARGGMTISWTRHGCQSARAIQWLRPELKLLLWIAPRVRAGWRRMPSG